MTTDNNAEPGASARPLARSATASGASPTPPQSAAARFRLPQRQSSDHSPAASPKPPLAPRRRSSLISFSSIEDVTQAFTEDLLDPRTGNRQSHRDESELSHWHSSPLAFAILPALGGLFFKNGSAFITDVLLLGLAAIFMNWSIRLPWDWYYSAQALRRDVEPDYEHASPEHHAADETAVETASSAGSSPKPSSDRKKQGGEDGPTQHLGKREQAAADLRQQESLALLATFMCPVLAAYLLHVIRAQLSGPSNSLVSDYNLSIFLLAAEIRPIRQAVRLISSRTLYLQRTVTGIDDPFASALDEKSTISKLGERITELEAQVSAHAVLPETTGMAQKTDVSELSAEIRKRYEPRLEGLERAVRRYEKRSTTLAMATEQRLQSLENRLQEALSLAAVAAQHSQNRGVVASVFDTISAVLAFPLKVAWSICIWPVVALEELYLKVKTIMLGPMPPSPRKRKSGRQDIGGSREDSRSRDKAPTRKMVR